MATDPLTPEELAEIGRQQRAWHQQHDEVDRLTRERDEARALARRLARTWGSEEGLDALAAFDAAPWSREG